MPKTEISEMIHNSAKHLSGLQSGILLLQTKLSDEILKLKIVDEKDRTVEQLIAGMLDNLKSLNVNVKGIMNTASELPVLNKADIETEILEFLKSWKKNKNYAFDFITKEFNMSTYEKKNWQCLIDKSMLGIIFKCIIENSECHAFVDDKKTDYKQEIVMDKEGNTIIIQFCNNGQRPNRTFTEEAFFTKGHSVGSTGKDGIGGYLIKKYMEKMNGMAAVDAYNDKYSFVVTLKFPII